MRRIKAKTVKSKETGVELNYRDLCVACLKAQLPNGYTINEMRALLEAIREFPKEDRKIISISEETYAVLVRQVKIFRWQVMDQILVDFADYIYNLEEINEPAVEETKE